MNMHFHFLRKLVHSIGLSGCDDFVRNVLGKHLAKNTALYM